ncbi:MAG: DUF1801 domain-containing protein [Flavobacteriales bacterium]|nr:DUF1801 domain-containing protein [Flavobacteriales bacterium]
MSPLRTCPNGHRFNKSSDCPTCPRCEALKAPKTGWLSRLSGPTRSALEHAGIADLEKLAKRTEKEVLALHGVGPASMPTLREALEEAGLAFRTVAPKKSAPKQPTPQKGTANTKNYLAVLPVEQRKALQALRKQILTAVPGIEEHFGYGMPAFKYNGHPVAYIGAATAHCALYGSVPRGFAEKLKDFDVSKGTIRFTPEKPLPVEVVKAIVREKCAEIEVRWGTKKMRLKVGK